MQITFLFGNGFDIGLGLKTSYEHFYEIYQKQTDEDDENIVDFKKMLARRNQTKEKIIDWSDFEKAFGEHANDFESGEQDKYLNRFKHFLKEFNKYLENQEICPDYSDQEKIGAIMKKGVTEYYHIQDGAKSEIGKLYYGSERIYNFITFNYTKSIDYCAKALEKVLEKDAYKKVGEIVHLHGYIEKSMILGVNDSSQIKNDEFANDKKVIKTLVKPQQNKNLKTTYDTKTKTVINSSKIVCVYGMSIGETDKDWWIFLLDWLAANSGRALVLLKYDEEYSERFPFMYQEKNDEVMEKLLSFSALSEEIKAKISERIFIDFNHNVFQIDLCTGEKGTDGLMPNKTILERISKIEEEIEKETVINF